MHHHEYFFEGVKKERRRETRIKDEEGRENKKNPVAYHI
jgi:hypothetical protein